MPEQANTENREIDGKGRTVRQLLDRVKYSVDYYQREYRWETRHVRDLIVDLTGKFQEEYQPDHSWDDFAKYPHYFLGTVILSSKPNGYFLVDGQQRLTTLTLLLIYLRNRTEDEQAKSKLNDLIYSERRGQRSFNLQVDERTACMEALFEGRPYDVTETSPSVQNIVGRYDDMEANFPDELKEEALPFFTEWLLDNVHLVEIKAYSDEDAYTIFETMNDRGLSLSPTEMLKGYLLSKITDAAKRLNANEQWKDRLRQFENAEGVKDIEADFFKAWLRSQYSTKIRERKKGAQPENFDRIGTEFHRWLRDNSDEIGLRESEDFFRFVDKDFNFYSRQYLRLLDASKRIVTGFEHVLYNAQLGFTLQYMLLLAPLKPDDDEATVQRKVGLVAKYLDILLAWRLWNFRSIAYSTMQYAMFVVMRDIRGLDADALAQKLHEFLSKEGETFASNDRLRVHQQNRYSIHRILARLTDHVETHSGLPSRYMEYVSEGRTRFEVEHIWADHPERHTDEFSHPADFAEYRNRIGGLLLLPKSFNGSYGDLPYTEKLPHYNTQNLLARSLHEQCYERNPGFLRMKQAEEIPFKAHGVFKKADLEERSLLYRAIAEQVWDPATLISPVPA